MLNRIVVGGNVPRTGVQVMTWGTGSYSQDDPEFSGMSHFIQSSLLGANIGHVAFKLTLPDTEKGRELKNRLKDTGIPCEDRIYHDKKVVMQKGKPTVSISTEKVYEVYFSYWPPNEGDDAKGFSFNDFPADTKDERSGVHLEYDPEWQEYLDPEVRSQSGVLGHKNITLDTQRRTHLTGHSKEEQDVLMADQLVAIFNARNSGISLVISVLLKKMIKMQKTKKPEPFSRTEKNLIARFLPEAKLDGKVTLKDVEKIHAELEAMENYIRIAQTGAYYNYVIALTILNGDERLLDLNSDLLSIELSHLGLKNEKALEYIATGQNVDLTDKEILAKALKVDPNDDETLKNAATSVAKIALTDHDKIVYEQVTQLRDLHKQIHNLDLGNPQDILDLKSIIGPPPHPGLKIVANEEVIRALIVENRIDENQFSNLKLSIKNQLDLDYSEGLLAQNKGIVLKGDLNAFYKNIKNIERLKEFKNEVEKYKVALDNVPKSIELIKHVGISNDFETLLIMIDNFEKAYEHEYKNENGECPSESTRKLLAEIIKEARNIDLEPGTAEARHLNEGLKNLETYLESYSAMIDFIESGIANPSKDVERDFKRMCRTYSNPWHDKGYSELRGELIGKFNPRKDEAKSMKTFVSQLDINLPHLSEEKADALLQSAITQGHPPSNVVFIPLKNDELKLPGLDPEAMINEMIAFVNEKEADEKEKRFNIVTRNCSVSCSRIITAGADNNRKHILERRALGQSISNPQIVHNNVLRFAGSLYEADVSPEQQSYYGALQNYLFQSFAHRAGNIAGNIAGVDPSYLGMLRDFTVGGAAITVAGSMEILARLAGTAAAYVPGARRATQRPQPMTFSSKAEIVHQGNIPTGSKQKSTAQEEIQPEPLSPTPPNPSHHK